MSEADWKPLEGLREIFLSEKPGASGDYWTSRELMAAYDRTFGARIGWKWDAVLRELKSRGWSPGESKNPRPMLVDWGCGTGIAARRMISAFGPEVFSEVRLHDRSAAAVAFATERLRDDIPVRAWSADEKLPAESVFLLSHVLNELPDLPAPLFSARAFLWVEPGTPVLSRRLVRIREKLRGDWTTVAPCPHQEICGMLAPANARHWCHHFAEPPPEVFHDGEWAKFGKRMGIDPRSLPVSFLVMDKKWGGDGKRERVIGRPRFYKGYANYLSCTAEGVTDRKVMKRKEPELHAVLEKGAAYLFPSAVITRGEAPT